MIENQDICRNEVTIPPRKRGESGHIEDALVERGGQPHKICDKMSHFTGVFFVEYRLLAS